MAEKKRIIVDYKTLPENMLERLALQYPDGFKDYLISYTNTKGDKVSAVPVETEDTYYLVKVSIQLKQMVEEIDTEDIDPEEDLGDEFNFEITDEDY